LIPLQIHWEVSKKDDDCSSEISWRPAQRLEAQAVDTVPRSVAFAQLTTVTPRCIVRSVDRRVYDHLKQAIEDLGSGSSFMRAPVRQAKDDARRALADFQQESLSPALRQASIVLAERLEDIDVHQPALNWEPLITAWKVVEREAGSEAWD
jgi:hypothetical protein